MGRLSDSDAKMVKCCNTQQKSNHLERDICKNQAMTAIELQTKKILRILSYHQRSN